MRWGVFDLVGLDHSLVSGLEKFEGPDPACWCAHGYAVCNLDIRGVAESNGDSVLWDRQEGRDAYDLIKWLGVRSRLQAVVWAYQNHVITTVGE